MSTPEQMEPVDPAVQPKEDAGFEALPRRAQIVRLRRLAQAALATYNLPPARLTLLVHLFNTTFQVDTSDGQRYVMRINRSIASTVEGVLSELEWLTALRRDTRLEVPRPVQTGEGALLTVASTPDLSRPNICVLFRWMPGRKIRLGLTPGHLEQVGELMAHIQNHASQWERPPSFKRGRVDWPIKSAQWKPDPFAPEILSDIYDLVAETLSQAEAEQINAVFERARSAQKALGTGKDVFGLIHADLHYGNLLFAPGTLRAIDFDDCGFGSVLYDPAVMLNALIGRPNYTELRIGLLAGYRRARPLPSDVEAYLNTFIALRQAQDIVWVLETRIHPALGEDWRAEARLGFPPLATLMSGSE